MHWAPFLLLSLSCIFLNFCSVSFSCVSPLIGIGHNVCNKTCYRPEENLSKTVPGIKMGRKTCSKMNKCELWFILLINKSARKKTVNTAYTVFSFISPSLNSASSLGYALKGRPSSLLGLCVQR